MEIRVTGEEGNSTTLLRSLDSAFAMIENYDSDQMEELKRHFKFILITDRSGGEFIGAVDTCRLGRTYVLNAEPLSLCMMLVHECRHAQLAEMGQKYETPLRAAIERECVEAEIRFAKRVPGSAEAIKKARRLLESEWWDLERHGKPMVDELRARGVPKWLAEWSVTRAAKGKRGRKPRA
jgi:hypothetical protein